MNLKSAILPAFLLVAAVQLFVPAKMIYDREQILAQGKAFRFKTAPIDPHDPFRGAYIWLRFEQDEFTARKIDWEEGADVYVALKEDENGYAQIQGVSAQAPVDWPDFVKTQAYYSHYKDSVQINLQYPFNRYYMEESKAAGAETTYQAASRDTAQVCYALVMVKNGRAVVRDVLINGLSVNKLDNQPQ